MIRCIRRELLLATKTERMIMLGRPFKFDFKNDIYQLKFDAFVINYNVYEYF